MLQVHQVVHVVFSIGKILVFIGTGHLQEPCSSPGGFIFELWCSGTFGSIPRAKWNHYQRVLCNGDEVAYLLGVWRASVDQLHKQDLGIEFTFLMTNELMQAPRELLTYQLARISIAALLPFMMRSIWILGDCCLSKMSTPMVPKLQRATGYATVGIKQAIRMEAVTHRSSQGPY